MEVRLDELTWNIGRQPKQSDRQETLFTVRWSVE